MVTSVLGEFYVFETQEDPAREELAGFFGDLGEDDVLEVRVQSESGDREPLVYHVTRFFLDNDLKFMNLALPKSGSVFQTAARVCLYGAVLPVFDHGNCVSILKKQQGYYEHFYRYEGGLDLSFLDRYERLILVGLNEYSVELYKRAVPLWSGSQVILVGADWRDYLDVLPVWTNVKVDVADSLDQIKGAESGWEPGKFLYVIEGLPKNEGLARYESGIMYYDEVMTLTFMFSYVISPGKKNPDKKFFLIDGFFRIEGIFGVWNKIFTAARYAMAKGYIPIFQVVSSDANIYSDHEGDDIWDKFFCQPGGYELEEVHQSSYLALSPNMNILNTVRYLMDQISAGTELTWPKGVFNKKVKDYIESRRMRFLPRPERTLGVLIRGTDYIKNPLPNHPKHATVDMVVERIAQAEKEWDFDRIYLATEDQEICRIMRERYGERLTYTDQERYTVAPGQLLVELHQEKKAGEGFRLGAEYLCSVNLLSRCASLIASGSCGALTEALRENGGQYQHVFVFQEKS